MQTTGSQASRRRRSRRSLLRLESFQEWLTERQAHIVGRAACEGTCPLANWLSTSVFHVPCEVTHDGYQFSGSDTVHPLPSWARAFIRAVDFTVPLDNITGSQALALLDCISDGMPVSSHIPCLSLTVLHSLSSGSITGRML